MTLEWRPKGNIGARHKTRTEDVFVSRVNGGGRPGCVHMATSITFRNDCFEKITKSGHISFAVKDKRLYFRDDPEGYKLIYPHPKTTNPRISSHRHDLSEFVGNYDLQYDVKEKLYFVEAKQ